MRLVPETIDSAQSDDYAIIFGMGPDPEPQNSIRRLDAQRSIVHSDANGVEPIHTLEMQ